MLPDLPLRVFLSHTADLSEFPPNQSFIQFAKDAVTKAGHVPVDMSDFPASALPPSRLCRERVVTSDVLVCVAGFRYGSPLPDNSALSYTEYEFEAANSARIPILAFLIDEKAEIPAWMTLDYEHGNKQRDFRSRILRAGITVRTISNPTELKLELYAALTQRLIRRVRDVQDRDVEPIPAIDGVKLLPFYLALDTSDTLDGNRISALNRTLPQIADAVAANPILSDKIRFSVVGYSSTAQVILPICDIADQKRLPELLASKGRRFSPVLDLLTNQIEIDVRRLKADGYLVHRPAIFFLSSGAPDDAADDWHAALERLKRLRGIRPSIIPIGVGEADPRTMSHFIYPSDRSRLYMLGEDGSAAAGVIMMAEVLITSVIDSGNDLHSGSGIQLPTSLPAGLAVPRPDDDFA